MSTIVFTFKIAAPCVTAMRPYPSGSLMFL